MKLEDLPEYIQKHSSRMVRGIKIEFPVFMATDRDREIEIPKAEKWLKQHSAEYNTKEEYWFIEDTEERKPFLELSDLPQISIGGVTANPREMRGKLKNPKRVTQFARKR